MVGEVVAPIALTGQLGQKLLIGIAADGNGRQSDIRGTHAIEQLRVVAAAARHAIRHEDDVLVTRV